MKHKIRNLLLATPLLASMLLAYGARSQCQELIWQDEFNGTTVDRSKWDFDIGDGCPELCGWGNAEEQYYREENAAVQNGNLIITTNYENYGGKPYTSAKLTTSGLFNVRYGRIEASMKLPSAGGIWPAFWLLPENGSWPYTGEIDIMEAQHANPESIGGTVHYDNGGHQFNGREYHAGVDLSQGYHEYAVEWEPNEIRWYVDDQLYHTVTPQTTVDPWPFDEGDWYIILNVAVGGLGTPYTGHIAPTPADYPTQMEVDYVRVYSGTFNTQLIGDNKVYEGEINKTYSISPISGATYSWSVPAGAVITSGQGTNSITVDWGTSGGDVAVDVSTTCGTNNYRMQVAVEPPRSVDFTFEDFESNRNISYLSGTTGVLSEAIANPGGNSVNNSSSVGRYVRNAIELYDVMLINSPDIGNALEFVSGKKAIFMDVYTDAPVGTEILLQLEDGSLSGQDYPAGRHSRYTATTTSQNSWVRLEFELLDQPDGAVGAFDVDQMAILIDPNSNAGHTVYFDNLQSMVAPDKQILEEVMLADYEGTNQVTEFFSDGVYTEYAANPAPNAVNESASVASYTRNSGSTYDVISFNTSAIENAGPFKDGDNIFFMDIYTSAAAGTEIMLSLENEVISAEDFPLGRNSQYTGVVEVTNSWHTVKFIHVGSPDAGTSDLSVDEISLLFDPNSSSSDTYYIDNFRYGITAYPPTYVFGQTIQNYDGINNLTVDTASTGVYAANVSNPAPNTVNGSAQVARYDRNITETYDVLFFDTQFISDASAYASEEKRFAMDVYTDAPVGTIISWQLEASSISNSSNYPQGRHSVYQAAVREQNSWHTLEFVLAATPDLLVADSDIDNVVLLFDPGVTSGHTFYIDNLRSLTQENVEEPILSRIEVSPSGNPIEEGATLQFAAQAFDQNDNTMAASYEWSATGGSIDLNSGLFTGTEAGTFTITATSDGISGTAEVTVEAQPPVGHALPGIVEAEDYNAGGEGVGYHDTSAGNTGGAYRTDDVDIETTGDVSGEYNIGWTDAGEWLDYTIDVQETGAYDLQVRVASPNTNGQYSLHIDGTNVSGIVAVPNTGSWQAYTTLTTSGVQLSAGVHTMRLFVDNAGFNINFIEAILTTEPPVGDPIPGIIQAENFSDQSGVQTESTTDTGGGENVGWIDQGDWMDYTVNVASAGTYSVDFRVAASGSESKTFELLSGGNLLTSVGFTATGGWQNWITVNASVELAAGTQTLRLRAVSSGFNVNWMEFVETTTDPGGCTFEASTGDYTAEVTEDANGTSVTFIPTQSGTGDPTCILYYGTSPTGPYPGYGVIPNEPYQINAASGETVYFYYAYSLSSGGENNTGSNPHSFVVGECSSTSRIATEEVLDKPNLRVFPNPVQDYLHLQGVIDGVEYELFNLSGQRFEAGKLSGQPSINVQSLPKGVYILEIRGKETQRIKVVKN